MTKSSPLDFRDEFTRAVLAITVCGAACLAFVEVDRGCVSPSCLLQEYSEAGSNRVVSGLLRLGTDIHSDDDAALRRAAANGRTETLTLLLDRGADIHARGDFALRLASANGHTDTVKTLLDRGADPHAFDDEALYRAGNGSIERLLEEHDVHYGVRPGTMLPPGPSR